MLCPLYVTVLGETPKDGRPDQARFAPRDTRSRNVDCARVGQGPCARTVSWEPQIAVGVSRIHKVERKDPRVKTWIGIDVSKDQLDVCLLKDNGKEQSRQFRNDPEGHEKLARWVRSQDLVSAHFCMEHTGGYSMGIALFLADNDLLVSVENPTRIKSFRTAKGTTNKTDKADARTIAHYCRQMEPEPWRASAPEVRQLCALMRRYDDLLRLRQQEKTRQKTPGLAPAVGRSIDEMIAFLNQQIDDLLRRIRKHIDQHPGLKEDLDLLRSIPGIGEIAALWVLAELPSVQQFRAAKVAARFGGLDPQERSSGSSVRGRTHLSKQGNVNLRRALFLPAISAKSCNPIVKDLFDRLLARGNCKMSAIGACMRKLLMLAYGVLKSRRPFDAEFGRDRCRLSTGSTQISLQAA